MRYTSDATYPFDTDNRAYRRFLRTIGEHLDVIEWTTTDGRPTLITLRDLPSGDMFTVAVLDSREIRDPHALLAFTTRGALAAYGPFAGESAAANHAPQLALTNADVAATRAVPLHQPAQPYLTGDRWQPVPPDLARAARPDLVDSPTAALVLIDHDRHLLATVGPFPDHGSAEAWTSTPPVHARVKAVVVPLHPVVAGAWDR